MLSDNPHEGTIKSARTKTPYYILYILYYISIDDIPCPAFEGRSCFLPAILCRRWSYPTKLKRFSPIILRRLMRA